MQHTLEIEFLGTGTSTGVPQIGCDCEVCRSTDPRDNRLRTSAIVRYMGRNLLIDCGPDFRTQMLRASSIDLDALLVTHIHYDHMGGIDDLRAYCKNGAFPVYARRDVIADLRAHMPYCFSDNPYPGSPTLALHEVGETPFDVCGVTIEPLTVMHGKLPILGYRIGPMAYITDAKTISPEVIERLRGVRLLVMNALRIEPHNTHMSLAESLEVVEAIAPEETYFIHMSHGMGLHAESPRLMPDNVHLAHDGLIIHI